MLIINILNIFRVTRASAGFRPVYPRFVLAARAGQGVRLAAEVLALVTVRANAVRGDHVLPSPAPQRGTQHAGAHDDAPVVGRGLAHGDVDAADTHRLLTHFDHHFAVGRFVDDRIPRAATQHVGDVVEAAGPPAWSDHRSEERRVGKECRSRWSPYH